MSEPEAAQEPTMEEILASIRRIISEDDGGRDEPEAAADPAEPETEPAQAFEPEESVTEEPEPVQSFEPAEERETSNPDSEAYPSIAAVFTRGGQETFESGDEDASVYEPAEDAFESEPEQVNVAAFESAAQTGQVAEPEPPYEVFTEEAEANPGYGDEAEFTQAEFAGAEPVAEPDPVASTHEVEFEAAAREEVEEEVLSPDTESQVANLIGQLNQRPAAENMAGQAEVGSTTLEGLVREMLRPMLQNWLDENLPPIVERIVEREIKRVTRAR